MGKRVVVINSSPHYASDFCDFPPIGAVGTIISPLDEYGEYDVLFDHYPCPTFPDISWIVHKSMIVFIDEDSKPIGQQIVDSVTA